MGRRFRACMDNGRTRYCSATLRRYGEYRWSDSWGGKGRYETTLVFPAEGECIVVPQKVLFSDGDVLRFVIYASEGTMDEDSVMTLRKGAN